MSIENIYSRLVRKKIRVTRRELLDNAIFVFKNYVTSQSVLEFEFFEEEGSGLGPTLEFYSSIIDILMQSGVFVRLQDGTLMPAVLDQNQPIRILNKDYSIHTIFSLLGCIVARAIIDERVIDLPLSPVFWKILFH